MLFIFCFCHALTSIHCCHGSPAEKGLTFWPLFVMCHFPMWYPGSGLVRDCIDS